MPRPFGRLWRSGRRRAEVAEAAPGGEGAGAVEGASAVADTSAVEGTGAVDDRRARAAEAGSRIEAARERLKQTIPPPEEPDGR